MSQSRRQGLGKQMLIASAFGAVMIVTLVLVLRWGGPGRQWVFGGVLMLAIAGQLDWYGLNHRWPSTHRDMGVAVLLANIVGTACVVAGWITSRRVGAGPGQDVIG